MIISDFDNMVGDEYELIQINNITIRTGIRPPDRKLNHYEDLVETFALLKLKYKVACSVDAYNTFQNHEQTNIKLACEEFGFPDVDEIFFHSFPEVFHLDVRFDVMQAYYRYMKIYFTPLLGLASIDLSYEDKIITYD